MAQEIEYWESVRGRLSGPCLGASQDILSGDGWWDCFGLDGCRSSVVMILQRALEWREEIQGIKSVQVFFFLFQIVFEARVHLPSRLGPRCRTYFEFGIPNVERRERSVQQAMPARASWTNKKASGVDAFPNNANHGENRSVNRIIQQQTVKTSFTRTRN